MKSLLRLVVGGLLMAALPIVVVFYLVAASPIFLASLFLRKREPRGQDTFITPTTQHDEVIFNRIKDVSKLEGCNTRGIQYRWNTFAGALSDLIDHSRMKALDFGAGSLRDTWELTRRGFNVVAMDINRTQMQKSALQYSWQGNDPRLFSSSVDDLGPGETFDLILAFDVFEHLLMLDAIVVGLGRQLKTGGYLFVSVPNGRSLRERVGKLMHLVRLKMKRPETRPGVRHVNFRTPEGWAHYFEARGLQVWHHEMTIGPLVNHWHFVHTFPLGASGLARRFPNLERLVCPEFLMQRLDLVDQNLKKHFEGIWGWNLFVLTKKANPPS